MSDSTDFDNEIDLGDPTPIQLRYRIGGVSYVLLEPTEEVAVKWKNLQIKETKFGPDGKPTGLGNMADSSPYLVSLCLYKADEQGNLPLLRDGRPDHNALVPLNTIKRWPSRQVTVLFERAKEIGELGERETAEAITRRMEDDGRKLAALRNGEAREDPAKNEPSDMTSSSG